VDGVAGVFLHELVFRSPSAGSEIAALSFRGESKSYRAFEQDVRSVANGFAALGLAVQDRVAIFLDKSFPVATAIFAASAAGLVFVPVNPVLRPQQVRHILTDANVRVLITSRSRLGALEDELGDCPDLKFVFAIDDDAVDVLPSGVAVAPFESLFCSGAVASPAIEPTQMAAILYTSGSTGNPKGVVFSHLNLVVGAQSVAHYLKYQAGDRIINIPPYSFDFGLNQLFSSMAAGVTAVLHNFTAVEDLMATIVSGRVTGVSGVPTVMIQLAAQVWPDAAVQQVRYLSTTGGRMPEPAVRALRKSLPQSDLYLMYGLTEAFRSTYLPPEEVDRRPGSIGKAIPNAEILVVRPDGAICDPDEPGELVHKGVLVTLGYWNDAARTAERFRPAPGEPPGKLNPEIAVWSGDTVTRDTDGFIYYVGRRDEMIKTSGYRISPTEIEESVFASGKVAVAAAIGVEDDILGQAVVVFAVPRPGVALDGAAILAHCRRTLPAYMVPRRIVERSELPLNPNGKIDRKALAREYAGEPPPKQSADALDRPLSFLARWRDEVLDLLGLRRKTFASVADIFRWTFPDRTISPKDSFHSLGGDSLSYVNLYTGLSSHFGRLPDDWAERPIAALERLDRQRSVSAVSPDILLRVIALFALIVLHLKAVQPYLPNGAASAMLMISGMSFARFSWNEDQRKTLKAGLRFLSTIYLPLLVFLAVMFAAGNRVGVGHLLLIENWIKPTAQSWWGPGWYIENLFQCIALMTMIGAIPRISTFAFRRKFEFGVILVAAGLAGFAFFSFVPLGSLSDHRYVTLGFFWTFALGWLVAQASTTLQKTRALAIVVASVLIFIAIVTVAPSDLSDNMFTSFFGMSDRHFWFWIVAGAAFLLFGRDIVVPRAVNAVIVVMARSMLFVYLFYLQISMALPYQHLSLQLAAGTAISVALWLIWESLRRTWRGGAVTNLPPSRIDRPTLVEVQSRSEPAC
jgi:acyl-CoA ligase (AMP-forming) (exosortase A-associated)